MAVANVADTKIGRDVLMIKLGGVDWVQAYASLSRNIDIRTENLKSVKEFWDYDVATGGSKTLEVEFDVRDEEILLTYLNTTNWCECEYQIGWDAGVGEGPGTAVITKSNRSAPGEGKQKFSYTLKIRPA